MKLPPAISTSVSKNIAHVKFDPSLRRNKVDTSFRGIYMSVYMSVYEYM